VNVNTAPAPVLIALFEDLPESVAKNLIEQREKEPFIDMNNFKDRTKAFKLLNPNMADVKSDFFVLNSNVRFARVELSYAALVQRAQNGPPALLWQRQQ
jgi:general secretion pathway protein K